MAANETDAERWTRRTRDAATEATVAGVTPDAIADAVRSGITEGRRIAALRAGTYTPPAEPVQRKPVTAPPGSAIEALLKATGDI
jgi:hypothetical protein